MYIYLYIFMCNIYVKYISMQSLKLDLNWLNDTPGVDLFLDREKNLIHVTWWLILTVHLTEPKGN